MAKGNNFAKYKKDFDFSNNDNRNKNYSNTNNYHKANGNHYHNSNNGNKGLFVNPYSFIPISKQKPERIDAQKGMLSGRVLCTIDVQTPVFIPNTTFDYAENGHKHNVFYSYTDLSNEKSLKNEIQTPEKPIVPGSEIRGMIRNVYEQLTNSCFLEVDEFNLPYKRTNEPKELCIMCWNAEAGKWVLYYDIKKNKDYFVGVINNDVLYQKWGRNADFKRTHSQICNRYGIKNRVSFDTETGKIASSDNGSYYVHIPALMTSSKIVNNQKIFVANKQIIYKKPAPNSPCIELDNLTIERFEYVLGADENVKGGYGDLEVHKNYRKHYEHKLPLIVYVDKASKDTLFKDSVIYLSPACMGKEFFENKIPDILKMNAEHDKCNDPERACPACRLFGMVSENGTIKGRLRFCDAQSVDGTIKYSREITLPILASPRISSTEFYLRPPQNFKDGEIYKGIWNYDYFTTYSKMFMGKKSVTVFNRDSYDVQLAGRKVYWNRSFNHTTAQKTKMNTSVTPIEKGSFTFEVYFDKITEKELEKLLFCLELKDSAVENPTVHKIGTGKPIGMGQVKVLVNEVNLIEYKMNDTGEIERFDSIYSENEELRKEIEKGNEAKYIIKYSSDLKDKGLIDYPKGAHKSKGEIVEDIFTWFAKNRGSVSTPKIQQILPDILSDNQTLKKY